MKKKIKDLTEEEKENLKIDLQRLGAKYAKLKGKVLEHAIPMIVFNSKTNELTTQYSKETQEEWDRLDKQHCEEIINLGKHYGIDLKGEDS